MNRLFLLFLLFPLVALSQPVPPAATQAEVDTGANRYKYVSPLTLKNWSGLGGATGAVSQAQLNSSSNGVFAILVANDTTTSNGIVALELTRNAAVSNALTALLVANDTTTSNGLVTLETTRNAAVSNAVVTLLVANVTITSNGAVAFSMQASNDLYAIETIRNAAVSNDLVVLLVANDTTTSNGLVTLETTRNAGVSNGVIAYVLGAAVTNGDTRTTWINNLNIGNDFIVTNNSYVNGALSVNGAITAGGSSYFSNNVTMLVQLFVPFDNANFGNDIILNGTLKLDSPLGISATSTSLIHAATEDLSPALGDFILTEDISSGRLKKVSIGNLPTGSGEVNYVGDAGLTNSTKTSLAHSKQGVTNFLKTIEAGYGIIRTNQGTNLNFAIDPSVVGGTPAGNSGAIQFNQGGAFAGTNRLSYDRTNEMVRQLVGAFASGIVVTNSANNQAVRLNNQGLLNDGANELRFGVNANSNWVINASGYWVPTDTGVYDIGASNFRVRTNWMNEADISVSLSLRDPASINSGRGTLFAHPSDWKVTNQFNFAVTNPVAGQVLKVSSASISGGLNTVVLTNDFPSTTTASGMFLRDTNMFFDGGITTLYTNTFVANIGGVTNMLPTNILAGSKVRLEFQVQPGVTVGFPTITTAQWGGYAPFFSTNSGEYNVVEVSVPSAGVTNARHWSIGFELKVGTFFEAITNFVDRSITIQSTRRFTNYADANITINAATEVAANFTNAVAGNRSITLATPVIGASGSLSLVSDGSARTLAILSPSASVTWMSTNDTATATNILTSASKRSLFAWRVGMATDGVTTNIACWVKNQAP